MSKSNGIDTRLRIVSFLLIVLITPTSTNSEEYKTEYRAKYWFYAGLADYTFGLGSITRKIAGIPLSIGIGANSKFRPGIGVGTSLVEFYDFGNEQEVAVAFPLYIRFLVPLITKFDSTFIFYPFIFHIFITGVLWGKEGETAGFGDRCWFVIGSGVDILGPLRFEGGYRYTDAYGNRKSSFYLGLRLGLSGWHAETKKVEIPIRPVLKPKEKTEKIARRQAVTKKEPEDNKHQFAPDFSLFSFEEGIRLSLSELLGKRTVIYFWTPLSSQIKADMIRLQELYSKYRNDGLQVIGILAFPEDSVEALAFIDSAKISFVNLIGDRETAVKYRMADVAPGIVIIDEKKKIIANKKSNLTDELLKIIVPSR